jgi:hypothetical protein
MSRRTLHFLRINIQDRHRLHSFHINDGWASHSNRGQNPKQPFSTQNSTKLHPALISMKSS